MVRTIAMNFASANIITVESLLPQLRQIVDVLTQPAWGFNNLFLTEESCFSDFGITEDEFPQLSEDLGIALDPANKDDWWIYRVAAKLKVLAKA